MARLLAVLLLGTLATPLAHALDVAEAYAAIPHRRTPYDASASTVPAAQKASLARLFGHTDRGVVLRVEGMKAHAARDPGGVKRVVAQYDGLIAELQKENVAAEVVPVRNLVVEALRLQQRHFQSRPAGELRFARNEVMGAPDVKDASGRLFQAYGILVRTYPGEVPRNKTSFFDHLCALDFL